MHARRLIIPIAAAVAAVALAATAGAAVTARPSLVTTGAVTKVVVTVAGASGAARPTAVTVVAAGVTVPLRRTGARWASAALKPAAVAKLRALRGKPVVVRLRSAAGLATLRPRLAVPAGAGGTAPAPGGVTPQPLPPPAPGAAPLFTPAPRELTGNEAFEHFKQYFLNARFTDCPAGWPNCAVENLYDHCATGAFAYHRYTNVSGADINAYGQYQVTGAAARTDGSWGVEYVYDNYGSGAFYSWSISATGDVAGRYWGPGNAPPNPPTEVLTGLVYRPGATCR